MRTFFVFLGKEIAEIFKTRKIIAISAVFIIFAILSPLSAKFMKEIIKSIQPGLELSIPDPVFADSYLQFIKNLSQIGFLTVLLAFSGLVSEEKKSGTAMLVLTKGLPRPAFVLSKLCAAFLIYTVIYAVSAAICMLYTYLLFNGEFVNNGTLPALLMTWLTGLFVIALAHFISSIFDSFKISAIVSTASFLGLAIIGAIPKIGRFIPLSMVGNDQAVILARDIAPPYSVDLTVYMAIGLIILMAIISVMIFRKDEVTGQGV